MDDRCRLFFRHFFDDFEFLDFSEKGCWARCFGKNVGSSFRRVRCFRFFRKRLWGQMLRKTFWVVRGGPGGLLGASGKGPGASWGVLGLSGGVREASWEGLGRSWGVLGATLKAVRFRIDFLIDFERQKGAKREAFGEAKWSQNRSQNDFKSKSIFKSEKEPWRVRFKDVLRRS